MQSGLNLRGPSESAWPSWRNLRSACGPAWRSPLAAAVVFPCPLRLQHCRHSPPFFPHLPVSPVSLTSQPQHRVSPPLLPVSSSRSSSPPLLSTCFPLAPAKETRSQRSTPAKIRKVNKRRNGEGGRERDRRDTSPIVTHSLISRGIAAADLKGTEPPGWERSQWSWKILSYPLFEGRRTRRSAPLVWNEGEWSNGAATSQSPPGSRHGGIGYLHPPSTHLPKSRRRGSGEHSLPLYLRTSGLSHWNIRLLSFVALWSALKRIEWRSGVLQVHLRPPLTPHASRNWSSGVWISKWLEK